MESAVVIATGRGGGSLQMPLSSSSAAAAASISSFAQSAKKEWRAVLDHHSVRNTNTTNEELKRTNLGQSDERTIYEVQQGAAESLHVEFSSITIDDNIDNDILQQRLHNVCRQREELQHLEVQLRTQFIARSGIMQMQNNFDAQIKDHVNAAEHLKEQLQEKKHIIHELEIKMEEKNRELRAIKIDKETAWAKEDLLMEQNKELANFRRELDNSQAERVHNRNQIHELEEYIQEKERQILELKEQHRVAQETILHKDEQLREAQAWVAHAQEMDALQLTTNHSLQTELRDRTEQFNQFWLGYQRQFVDMERYHMQTIQQLQLQLAEARERGGMLTEQSSHTANGHSEDVSPFGQNKGNLFNNADVMLNNSDVLTNGDGRNASALFSTENVSSEGRDKQTVGVTNHLQERQSLATEQPPAANTVVLSDASMDQAIDRNGSDKLTEASILLGSTSNLMAQEMTPEPSLLDERSLLVCIVRAIPAGSGGQVRISSTLPNRLGKMLAPLHWHDYKKKYGKLDDFVANHPELFVIEGDYIQLREGAQEIISATAAVAKVAAAASIPYSSSFPSVAVTPMAQSHRLKKVPSNDSKSVTVDANGSAVSTLADTGGKSSQPSLLKNQHSNDICYDIVQGLSNVKIMSKSKDPLQLDGSQSGIRPGHSSMHMAVGNGVVPGLSTCLSKRSFNGRHGTNSGVKP